MHNGRFKCGVRRECDLIHIWRKLARVRPYVTKQHNICISSSSMASEYRCESNIYSSKNCSRYSRDKYAPT
jgi:hypothetical protein